MFTHPERRIYPSGPRFPRGLLQRGYVDDPCRYPMLTPTLTVANGCESTSVLGAVSLRNASATLALKAKLRRQSSEGVLISRRLPLHFLHKST
jgi:hypothetical protein